MASSEDHEATYSQLTTSGNARLHAGHNYNHHTYNYTCRQRCSDETLRGPKRNDAFMQAVVEGQLSRVRHFLRIGVDLDRTGPSNLTILHRAVLSGHEDVIEALIDAGADVNADSVDYGTPLCLAAVKDMEEIVDLLLQSGAKAGAATTRLGTALHCCTMSVGYNKRIATMLIDAGALVSVARTIDTRWIGAICRWDGDDRTPLTSLEDLDGWILSDVTPAFIAVMSKQSALGQLLLPSNVNRKFQIRWLGAKDQSSFSNTDEDVSRITSNGLLFTGSGRGMKAASISYIDSCIAVRDEACARLLIRAGADVELRVRGDKRFSTTLMVAARLGSSELVALLLDSGAPIESRNENDATALHFAAGCGHPHAVRLLCSRGALIDARDVSGRTPLFCAARRSSSSDDPSFVERYQQVLQTLIGAGADINARDSTSSPPLHSLLKGRRPNPGPVEDLIRAGADTSLRDHNGITVLALCVGRTISTSIVMAFGQTRGLDESTVTRLCGLLLDAGNPPVCVADPDFPPICTLKRGNATSEVRTIFMYMSPEHGCDDVRLLFDLGL